ncbi:MAG: MarC family protein [Kastovskya adunca ATA6-11-RM4]|nr:MarC family protein [Kastovskya adunca ATA6-11-RM4]
MSKSRGSRLHESFRIWLGETGIRAISRILGLFILAIAVQLILNGVADWLRTLEVLNNGG